MGGVRRRQRPGPGASRLDAPGLRFAVPSEHPAEHRETSVRDDQEAFDLKCGRLLLRAKGSGSRSSPMRTLRSLLIELSLARRRLTAAMRSWSFSQGKASRRSHERSTALATQLAISTRAWERFPAGKTSGS